VPIWADVLLAIGLALIFAVLIAVLFDRAAARAIQPHLNAAQESLENARRLREAARATLARRRRSASLTPRYALSDAPEADRHRRDEEPQA